MQYSTSLCAVNVHYKKGYPIKHVYQLPITKHTTHPPHTPTPPTQYLPHPPPTHTHTTHTPSSSTAHGGRSSTTTSTLTNTTNTSPLISTAHTKVGIINTKIGHNTKQNSIRDTREQGRVETHWHDQGVCNLQQDKEVNDSPEQVNNTVHTQP